MRWPKPEIKCKSIGIIGILLLFCSAVLIIVGTKYPDHLSTFAQFSFKVSFSELRAEDQSYVPKMDSFNCHDASIWPDVRDMSCDHLGASYVKDLQSDNFYLVRWDPKKLPIMFHMQKGIEDEYVIMIEEVFDYLNRVAVAEGIVDGNIVELSPELLEGFEVTYTRTSRGYLREAPNDLDIHMIKIDPFDAPLVEKGDAHKIYDRYTGELVDCEISLYINLMRADHSGSKLIRYFKHTVMHELLHCLGMTHNYEGKKYGSVMGAYTKYDDVSHEIKRSDITGIAKRKDYDLQVLKYIYTDKSTGFTKFDLLRYGPKQ